MGIYIRFKNVVNSYRHGNAVTHYWIIRQPSVGVVSLIPTMMSAQAHGKGGILGAEGATTMLIEGNKKEVEKVFKIISSIKGGGVSGIQESLSEFISPHKKMQASPGMYL